MKSKPRLTEKVMLGLLNLRVIALGALDSWEKEGWEGKERAEIERAVGWITDMRRWRLKR